MRKIKKVLIANRGEIALRIIRSLISLDIEAVVVYEEADRDAYYLNFADEAILLGEEAGKNYLDMDKIINAARQCGADAIHPGYGFLSENGDFAAACEQSDIIFIGPPPQVIRNLGDKVIARNIAEKANVPLVPGTQSLSPGDAGLKEALEFTGKFGYPVLLKALAGGGGRGMRRAENDADLKAQIATARSEALAAFNDDRIFMEKFVTSPRHVEVQILADSHGNVVHLGTRDCSIQRRYQKLVEIAPAALPEKVAEAIHQAAVAVAREAGYVNAGTVEFLMDPQTHEFWFMEVNTRLQVEHTVTEMITGVDIVRQQILIAEGRRMELQQHQIHLAGDIAIEVRVNAENPKNQFLPEGGKYVEIYQTPGGPGIRLDGIIYKGYRIPVAYDSLMVKLIVKGYEWDQTVNRLKRALNDLTIVGPKTTTPLYLAICDEPDFRARKFNTGYLETHPAIFNYPEPSYYVIDDLVFKTFQTGDEKAETALPLPKDKRDWDEWKKHKRALTAAEIEALKREGVIISPIKGKVSRVPMEVGDIVLAGDVLIDLEAMKMHTHIISEVDGKVADIIAEPGDSVDVGDRLMLISVEPHAT
ncbi:MAG: biotin carboxylase N-terminal domain-containing protein [Syntrophales bacterium]|nr:biotin carboxylase N-terminal domain-containing protein [Syntrophales bacterium]